MTLEVFGINLTEISTFTMIISVAIYLTKRMITIEKDLEKYQALTDLKHNEFSSVAKDLKGINTRLSKIEGKLS